MKAKLFALASLATFGATLSLAQDRPNTGFFGLEEPQIWSRNLVNLAPQTFLTNAQNYRFILTRINRSSNPAGGNLELLVGNNWVPFLPAEDNVNEERHAPIVLKDGSYRWGGTLGAIYLLTGYLGAKVSGANRPMDPYLGSDRLWQYFPARDGATYTVGNRTHILKVIHGGILQRQLAPGAYTNVLAFQGQSMSFAFPGFVLTQGTYRILPTGTGPVIMYGYFRHGFNVPDTGDNNPG